MSVAPSFKMEIVIGVISVIVLTLVIFVCGNFIARKIFNTTIKKFLVLPIIIVALAVMSVPNGVVNSLYDIYSIQNTKAKSFEKALKAVGFDTKHYVKPEDVTATKGKNIIVISMESLEKGYLGKEFEGLTPTLNRLAKQWNYYDMEQTSGCGWTSGSLYCHQAGLPAYSGIHGNDWFQTSIKTQLTGLGHILNKAHYQTKFLIGNDSFAGTNDLLKTYGISTVSRHNAIGKYPQAGWGMYDKDLFNEAKLQLEQMTKDGNKPFALFLSTVGTHFVNGIYDKRMEQYIDKKNTSMEFCVATLDYLINDFINYLKDNNLLNNTVVYIFPDHLLMGGGEIVDKLKKDKRELYFITNASKKSLPIKTERKLYQLDLPRLIISGAGIKTNAKFLVDDLETTNINKHIMDKKVNFVSLNSSALKTKNIANGFNVNLSDDSIIITNADDNIIESVSLTKSKEIKVVFDKNMKLLKFSYGISPLKQQLNPNKDKQQYHLFVKYDKGEFTTYLGDSYATNIIKTGKNIEYTKQEVDYIRSGYNTVKAFISPYKPPKPKVIKINSNEIQLVSSEYTTSHTQHSKIRVGKKIHNLKRGLNLLIFKDKKGSHVVENFDTYASKDAFKEFLQRIEHLEQKGYFWAVASHDAVTKHKELIETAKKLGLKKLPYLNWRLAYVAYKTPNGIEEITSPKSVSIVITAPKDFLYMKNH